MNAQNRLFAIIAIGLVVLLAIGLLGIGGWALIVRPRQRAAQAEAAATQVAMAVTATATATLAPPATPTPRLTSTPVVAPATNTPVVAPASPTFTPQLVSAQPTETPKSAGTQPTALASPTVATEETTPQTGFGPGIAVLSAIGLSGLVVISRRLRRPGS